MCDQGVFFSAVGTNDAPRAAFHGMSKPGPVALLGVGYDHCRQHPGWCEWRTTASCWLQLLALSLGAWRRHRLRPPRVASASFVSCRVPGSKMATGGGNGGYVWLGFEGVSAVAGACVGSKVSAGLLVGRSVAVWGGYP